jgi:NADPH:quinone reductase-like Zn-dependent oxidoreductase
MLDIIFYDTHYFISVTFGFQLAAHLGLRVLATGDSAEELNFLEDLGARVGGTRAGGALVSVLDTRSGPGDLVRRVLEETGHLGVACVLEADSSVGPATTTEFKRAMLECVGSHGVYVTSRRSMQVSFFL